MGTISMKKVAHLLGNGPSKNLFVNDPAGDIYGCNLGEPSLPMTATFIMDKLVIDHIANNAVQLNYPVIAPNQYKRIISQVTSVKLQLLDTIPSLLKTGESTGHRGATYLIEKGYQELHLWGFDSMFRNTIESDTHEKIPEGPADKNNYKKWRGTWQPIFDLAKSRAVEIITHKPEEANSDNLSARMV